MEALSQLNFRDIGGLPAAGGRQIRAGVIYRSEGPASFSPAHRQELRALGIKLICDLRADIERRAAPNDWSSEARIFNLEITNDLRNATNEGWGALRDDPSEAGARRAMRTNYAAMPGALHPFMAALIGALIGDEKPVLLHCTAGKDRTGVLVAMLLTLLGVKHEAVLADYVRSNIFAKNLRLGGSIAEAFVHTFGFAPSEATIDAMIGVDPENLAAAFDAVISRWGSVDEYFRSAGVNADIVARLRDALLVEM